MLLFFQDRSARGRGTSKTCGCAWVRILKPKSRWSGAAIQHAKIPSGPEVDALDAIVGDLDFNSSLYPQHYAIFRGRWNRCLKILGIPEGSALLPGGLRGGGAVAAYRHEVPIDTILWRMRIQNMKTLNHYLQEVAAVSVLGDLPLQARERIKAAAAYYPFLLASLGISSLV